MSLFARFVRFFIRTQTAPVVVLSPRTSESQPQTLSQTKIDTARANFLKKRAEREGSWGETQFFKPD